MEPLPPHIRYRLAKERIDRIKGFYMNLLAYCIVIPILAYINYRTTSYPWVLFSVAGWGLGLILHGFIAHGFSPFLGRNWEVRKIKELMSDENF